MYKRRTGKLLFGGIVKKRRFLVLFAVISLMCVPAIAPAALVNFDDLTVIENGVPNSYQGLNWVNYSNLTWSLITNTTWRNSYHNTSDFPSNPNAAFGGGGYDYAISSSSPFNLVSAFLWSWANNDTGYNASVTITAYRGGWGGTQVAKFTLSSLPTIPPSTPYSLGLNNVDYVTFNGDSYFLMDNLTYYSSSSVPIPGAVWLLGSGLLGLIGVRRKFKN